MAENVRGAAVAVTAELLAIAGRRSARRLRRLDPRPLGLAPGTPQPTPAVIESQAGELTLAIIGQALLTGSHIPITSMTLRYGSERDLSAPLIDITTDFTEGHKDSCPVEYELGRAEHRDFAASRGDTRPDPLDEPAGPFGSGTLQIDIDGAQRTVPTMTYLHYHGCQFEHGRVLVTVVCRHAPPEKLVLAVVTDFEPYLRNRVDREAIKAWLKDQPGY